MDTPFNPARSNIPVASQPMSIGESAALRVTEFKAALRTYPDSQDASRGRTASISSMLIE